MTFRRPLRVGSPEHAHLEAVWEVLVEVAFVSEASASTVDALQDRLWERLNSTVREVLGPYVHGAPGVEVYDVRGRGGDTPLFPMVIGCASFTSDLDIVELVERGCAGTELVGMAFDARGRAYDLKAQIEYIRRPEHDGERAAEISSTRSTA